MKITRQQIASWLFVGVLLTLAWFLRAVLAYFLVAMIVAFLGAPLMRFFEKHIVYKKRNLPTWIPATLVLLILIGIVVGFISIVFPPLIEQTSSISSISKENFDKSFAQPINDIKLKLESWGVPVANLTTDAIQKKIESYLSFSQVQAFAMGVISSLSSTVGWIFAVLFITFFFLKEKFLLTRLFYILTPDQYEPRLQNILRDLNEMLGRYFRSVLIQITVFGTYIFTGLTIAGEKYALTVALFSGLINLVSYVGPLLGISFALIFCVLSHIGADFYGVIVPQMYEVVFVYVIAILLDNFFSYPLIFSKSLKVHPLELFFVILAGAQLGGLGGMMIAAPLYTVIRIIAKEFLSGFEIVQSMTKHL